MGKVVLSRSTLIAAGILVAVSMAFAKTPSSESGRHSKKSANVQIIQAARIPDGPILQPGEYQVILNSDSTTPEIGFYQKGKLVAQTPAKLVDEGKKIGETKLFLTPRDPTPK